MERLRDWVLDRFGLRQLKETVLDKRDPKTPWYYGDGASLLLLLGVLIGTGVIMALSYVPSPDGAYSSVRYITEEQSLGWFVRGLHYWSAGLMVVMIFVHVFRQILVGGYKFPREGTWLIGTVLFFLVLTMSFTGYVLRWDQRALGALQVVLHMFYLVPFLGEYLVEFVQGGREVGAWTLTRFFAVHVILVPLALLFLVGWHLYLVILHGVTSRGEKAQPIHTVEQQREVYKAQAYSNREGEDFYPSTAAKSGAMAFVVFVIALSLALFVGPAQLMEPADRVEPSFPAEEWWFWWYSSLLALLPAWLAPIFELLFPLTLLVAMVLLPILDRGPFRGMRRRPVAVGFVALSAIALLGLTSLRLESPWTAWPDDEPPPVPARVVLSPEAEQGRQLFHKFACNSCHSVAGHGRQVGPDLARMEEKYSAEDLRRYILNPPEGIPMPAYERRLTEDQLARIVEYVLVAQTFPRER